FNLVTREKKNAPAAPGAPAAAPAPSDDIPPKQSFSFVATNVQNNGILTLDPQVSFLKKIGLVKLSGASLIMQAHLGSILYLGVGTFLWNESTKTYTFTPDLKTFTSCQQRHTYRIEARPPGIKITFTINGTSIQGSDLSGGGCSFFARGEFAKNFVPQKEFEKVKVRINSLELVVPRAEVVAVKKQSGSVSQDTAKVAFKFLDLPEEIEEQLCQYINLLAQETSDRFEEKE
ncbi:MAG: PilZ domain-containing protein, partial [Bacteriovoracaceae bacterium]|nr:PilZ domain-containing protein [Bacteriovoracaceae bacterium]